MEQYGDAWEALEKASAYSPVAYHVACTWGFRMAARFIRFRPGKVVFDNSDQLAGHVRSPYLSGQYSGQLRLERYCLEHAQGIRCRDMSTQLARKSLGYRIRGKRILFLDYAWGLRNPTAEESPREPLSVSFCGSLVLEKKAPEKKYLHYLDTFKKLSQAGIPVHVYPGISFRQGQGVDDFSEYLEWAAACPSFKLHDPVAPEEMSRELARYEFGVYVWGNRFHLRDDDPMNKIQRRDWELGSRFLDYAEAGLVILTHDGRFPAWLVRRYRIGVVVEDGILANPKEWLTRNRLPAPTSPVRDLWTMPRQIQRLERFYESL